MFEIYGPSAVSRTPGPCRYIYAAILVEPSFHRSSSGYAPEHSSGLVPPSVPRVYVIIYGGDEGRGGERREGPREQASPINVLIFRCAKGLDDKEYILKMCDTVAFMESS